MRRHQFMQGQEIAGTSRGVDGRRRLGWLLLRRWCVVGVCCAVFQMACVDQQAGVAQSADSTTGAELSVAEADLADVDFESIWQTARQTLTAYSFQLDRQDRRAGLMRTAPEVGRQWFEWWRRDVPTGVELLKSSLHTTLRQVQVEIVHTGNYEYRVVVRVDKVRWSFPERQVTTVVASTIGFSERLPTVDGQRVSATQERRDVQYIPMGRDPVLERQILDELTRQLPPGTRARTVRLADLEPDGPLPMATTQPSTTSPIPTSAPAPAEPLAPDEQPADVPLPDGDQSAEPQADMPTPTGPQAEPVNLDELTPPAPTPPPEPTTPPER